MTGNKRKVGQTSPEGNIHPLSKNNRTSKVFKYNKTMSISQSDFQQIKSIIDESLHKELTLAVINLATKDDINNINKELSHLRQQNLELADRVQHFENRCRLLEDELELQSREIKGKNIIFTIPKDGSEPQDRVQDISKLLLDNQSPQMPQARKLSENNNMIKLKLNTGSNEIATQMLRNASKLKGTGAYIQRDLSKQSQLKRRILLGYRKAIKTKKPTEAVLIKNNTLLIGDKIFYLNNNNILKYKNKSGEAELQNMFGDLNFGNVSDGMTAMSSKRQSGWSRSDVADTPGMAHEKPNCSRFMKN